MKEIQLTKGYVALVDDEDFEALSKHKWRAVVENSGYVRAIRNSPRENGKQKTIYMHRFVLNTPADMHVDHIDGNPLNNCKSNLRLCTNAENQRNKGKQKKNTTGFCGVVRRHSKGFQAQLKLNRKTLSFGTYPTPEEAARAYDAAALKYHGEFARLNFPQ